MGGAGSALVVPGRFAFAGGYGQVERGLHQKRSDAVSGAVRRGPGAYGGVHRLAAAACHAESCGGLCGAAYCFIFVGGAHLFACDDGAMHVFGAENRRIGDDLA